VALVDQVRYRTNLVAVMASVFFPYLRPLQDAVAAE
jgi:hypothetical protein